MTVGAVLLAAGSARRMGADKLSADLGGRPLIDHALDAIARAGLAGPLIAVPPGGRLDAAIAGRGTAVAVADHARGIGHSLAAAIRAVPADWQGAIVCLADMPFVAPATLADLARRAADAAIVRPWFGDRPGNPVLWGRDHFPALAALTGDNGGRALFDLHPVQRLDCGDRGILFDVDTPEALSEARDRLRAT